MTGEFARHEPHQERWNIIKKEIGNQMSCKMKRCGSRYVKRGIV